MSIKVSNAQFTERFTREARAIAALNHTNICHLYDVGPNYLVMEYVEGPDLRGPLDFSDALPIVQQLVDGIEAEVTGFILPADVHPPLRLYRRPLVQCWPQTALWETLIPESGRQCGSNPCACKVAVQKSTHYPQILVELRAEHPLTCDR